MLFLPSRKVPPGRWALLGDLCKVATTVSSLSTEWISITPSCGRGKGLLSKNRCVIAADWVELDD